MYIVRLKLGHVLFIRLDRKLKIYNILINIWIETEKIV